ncbi:MAG: Bifunctional ligase/repressor BirA [Syntrophorhabdus sp. PtaU1.Bin002]|nr:MAG: Bifunctional ligase/repressor BirA [Syntrophorhabdus sp. PtaU1.Bin002]
MDRIREVLTYLRDKNDYVSGDYMSGIIGISRTAVWKYINHLERLGYRIDKLKGKGYRLAEVPDKLYPWEIERYVTTKVLGKKIIYKDNLDSTNSFAFKLALGGEPEGTCIIAETQKSGKGRLGRKWFSPAGKNLYMSVLLRPRIPPSAVYPITFLSSLAVYDTVETLVHVRPILKWPNDVLIAGRKVCGTLLELSTEADMVRFVIVGIGLNINMKEDETEEEIRQKATSFLMEARKSFERTAVCGILLDNLERYYGIFREKGTDEICSIWEHRAKIKGKYLEITQMGESYRGISEGIDKDGAMLLTTDGTVQKIIAGDVSF